MWKMLILKYTVVTSPFEHTPLLPMSPLVTILGYPPPPSPRVSHSGGHGGTLPILQFFSKPPYQNWCPPMDDWLWSYVKYTVLGTSGPKHCIRSQTPSNSKFPQLFASKGIPANLWTKWGLVCQNLIWGCRVMPDQPF